MTNHRDRSQLFSGTRGSNHGYRTAPNRAAPTIPPADRTTTAIRTSIKVRITSPCFTKRQKLPATPRTLLQRHKKRIFPCAQVDEQLRSVGLFFGYLSLPKTPSASAGQWNYIPAVMRELIFSLLCSLSCGVSPLVPSCSRSRSSVRNLDCYSS